MPSLKALRKRIATVRSTQQITRAMKMVAAAKLRRAQEAAARARRYAAKLTEMFAELAGEVTRRFVAQETDAVYLVYTRFRSALSQLPSAAPVLPVAAPSTDAPVADYIFEPKRPELLAHLLPRYIEVLVTQALLEAIASEHGARMTAMENATRNAGEMIDRLTLSMNRARQATITKELMEIVSGAEALKG